MTCQFCNESIEEHEAGRETDLCIAKMLKLKNAGYHRLQSKLIGTDLGYSYVYENAKGSYVDIPHYSTDMNKAIELWDDYWKLEKYTDGWFICEDEEYGGAKTCGQGETPMLAICRAFIKSKEGESQANPL